MGPKEIEQAVSPVHKLANSLIDQCGVLTALDASNEHLIYSRTISDRMSNLPAHNGFELLKSAQINYTLVRLCALWESKVNDRYSMRKLQVELSNEHTIEALIKFNSSTTASEIRLAIARANKLVDQTYASGEIRALNEARHNFIAHTLSKELVGSPTYGAVRWMLSQAMLALDDYRLAIWGHVNNWPKRQDEARRDALEFWSLLHPLPSPRA